MEVVILDHVAFTFAGLARAETGVGREDFIV